MQIVIFGSGNVATHFALAFHKSGHKIAQVFSRNLQSAQTLANQVDAEATNIMDNLLPTADVYIFSITDDALYEVASQLKPLKGICVHTSGSVPMDVLKPISKNYGVLYSPQTFVKYLQMDYSALPFCIEASNTIVSDTLVNLVKTVSPKMYFLDSVQRSNLHLSAVFVNNFGNAINAIAQDIAKKHGIPFEILYPLIEGTFEKAKFSDLWHLQTGPAVRNDRQTILKHQRLLANTPELLELYSLITNIIQQNTKPL